MEARRETKRKGEEEGGNNKKNGNYKKQTDIAVVCQQLSSSHLHNSGYQYITIDFVLTTLLKTGYHHRGGEENRCE